MEQKSKITADDPLMEPLGELLDSVMQFGVNVKRNLQRGREDAVKAGQDPEKATYGFAVTPEFLNAVLGMAGNASAVVDALDQAGVDIRESCTCDKCKLNKAYKDSHDGTEMPRPTVDFTGLA